MNEGSDLEDKGGGFGKALTENTFGVDNTTPAGVVYFFLHFNFYKHANPLGLMVMLGFFFFHVGQQVICGVHHYLRILG